MKEEITKIYPTSKDNIIEIVSPEGCEIDKENSTFECIKFKPIKSKRWRDDKSALVEGYFINFDSKIVKTGRRYGYTSKNYNIFVTEKQVKFALAIARISQIMANDERFGGPITDEEWDNCTLKYGIRRIKNYIDTCTYYGRYSFLAFHTEEQRDLFLEENEDLIKDYLMID